MAKRNGVSNALDALMADLLAQLETLWKARGLTQGRAVVQQTVDKWRKGSKPTLRTLFKYVKRLDGDLQIRIVDTLAKEPSRLPIDASPAAIEVAAVVDRLPPAEQKALVAAVHNLARTFRVLRNTTEREPD